jgi:predicted SnoaL-like aldol condensation-catalyzing enzyme
LYHRRRPRVTLHHDGGLAGGRFRPVYRRIDPASCSPGIAMPSRLTPKEIAVDFLVRCAAGDVDEAFLRYVDEDFRHHNVHFPGDRDSLRLAMRASAANTPPKMLAARIVLEDGSRVSTLSEVSIGDLRLVLAHVFHFRAGRIVELWDVGQQVPPDSPNANGPV